MEQICIELGKKILTKQCELCRRQAPDAALHIVEGKLVVESIEQYLREQRCPTDIILPARNTLITFSRDLFVEVSADASTKGANGDGAETREESEQFFDYIYKHGEYPN